MSLWQQALPHLAGPLFWWMAKNFITNNIYKARDDGLLNPTGQIKYNTGSSLELLQVIQRSEPVFIKANQASTMICKVRSLTSPIKTCPFLEEIITYSNGVFNSFESDMAVGIWMIGNPTWDTAKTNVIVKLNGCSEILALELLVKKVRSVRHCIHICEVLPSDILMRLTA